MKKIDRDRLELFHVKPENDEDLHYWIWRVLGIWIPKNSVCPGHDAPFKYLADTYFGRVNKSVVWSCRSGSKSFLHGLRTWLKSIFNPNYTTVILGGSLDQSKKAYKATQIFWDAVRDIGGDELLVGQPKQTSTILKNGSSYSISTASSRSVRGPHPVSIALDEVDEMSIEIFNAALNQPQSSCGYDASWHISSTFHKLGLMQDVIDSAKERGFTTYKWCILEVMALCGQYELDVSCESCSLDKWCEGRLLHVANMATDEQIEQGVIPPPVDMVQVYPHLGFNTYADVCQKVANAEVVEEKKGKRHITPIDVAAELFCERPSKRFLVYDDFDELAQVKDMRFVSEPHQGGETGSYVVLNNVWDWKFYRSIDFGLRNPFVCLWIAVSPQGIVHIFDELYQTGLTTRDAGFQISGMYASRDIKYEFTVADASSPEDIRVLSELGIKCLAELVPVQAGILRVKELMRQRAGAYGIYVNSKCFNTVFELSRGYRYPDDTLGDTPRKEHDHAMDCLKNWAHWYRKGTVSQAKGIYWIPTQKTPKP